MLADITFLGVVWYLVAGFIIGLLARAILPGKQHMGIIATVVLGVLAALAGGFIWNAIFPDNDGIAWIGSIIVAVIVLFAYDRIMVSRRRTASSP